MAKVRAALHEYKEAVEAYAHAAKDTAEHEFRVLEHRIHDAWAEVEREAAEERVELAHDVRAAHHKLVTAFHRGEHDVEVALHKVGSELDEVRDRVAGFIESF